MLGRMESARPDDGPRSRAGQTALRRGPLIAEIVALFLLSGAESVPFFGGTADHGMVAALYTAVVPGLGPAAAGLAVLRRRFVTRTGLLGAAVVAISLLSTASAVLAHPSVRVTPGLIETLAIALLVGAGCRRFGRYPAIGLAVSGGVAMAAAPVLRYGVGSSMAPRGRYVRDGTDVDWPCAASCWSTSSRSRTCLCPAAER
jgi:hypothetical protein